MTRLNVLISGGFTGAYQQLLPGFEQASGIRVTTGSGASQGTGPHTIAAQLARGVPADVVILSREGLYELLVARRIVAGTDFDLARAPIGVAVRTGTSKPDVSTIEAFKQVLLKARTVAVPGSTSGIWLRTDLFPRLGIAERIRIEVGPRVQHRPGNSVCSDVFGSHRGRLERNRRAKRLIEYFVSARASEAIRKSGMEPTAS